ncbi:hypothetical protein QN224_30850 [Sinorhizobium sp. 8-89]|uniref:hypothetical protein n=1 Tax=Sinorhizobium sp. 7-81 TaxID=3049087 RepID=UPI0024C3E0E3|nr:hypothetical protein [Sinorhizobium sp. 7-81]MDK1389758.1 hypothetical protein [Sinorhizobium sp. 7-81]
MADFEISKVQDPLPEQEAAPDYWSGRDNFAGYASRPSWRAAFSLLPRAFFAFGCNAVKKKLLAIETAIRPCSPCGTDVNAAAVSHDEQLGTTTDSG